MSSQSAALQFRAVGRSENLKGQVVIEGHLMEQLWLLFLPKSGGEGAKGLLLVPTALAISKMHPFYNIVTFLGKKILFVLSFTNDWQTNAASTY